MNVEKRTFNPLLSKSFRYSQSEGASLKYRGNWGPAKQDLTVSASTWETESGDAVISGKEIEADNKTTAAIFSGPAGESTIINTVTLSDGQIDSREIKLNIISDSHGNLTSDYWNNGLL